MQVVIAGVEAVHVAVEVKAWAATRLATRVAGRITLRQRAMGQGMKTILPHPNHLHHPRKPF